MKITRTLRIYAWRIPVRMRNHDLQAGQRRLGFDRWREAAGPMIQHTPTYASRIGPPWADCFRVWLWLVAVQVVIDT